MNYIDLFSGIGGFALGAYKAGFKVDNHFYSEIDKFGIELYKKRFPDSICLGDITKINTNELKEKYPGEWVITGGFPCQDISIAGKGAGLDGERSGLWFEMWRIIRELRPKFVIAENVSAITFRGLDRVLSSLAEIGYDVEWQCIRASDLGAPHRRERIWIVAYPNSNNDSINRQKKRIENEVQGIGRKERFTRESIRANNNTEVLAYPMRKGLSGLLESDADAIQSTRKKRLAEQCFDIYDDKWEKNISSYIRVDDGIPRKVDRVRGLGNAIVPQIAEMLFKRCLTAI